MRLLDILFGPPVPTLSVEEAAEIYSWTSVKTVKLTQPIYLGRPMSLSAHYATPFQNSPKTSPFYAFAVQDIGVCLPRGV